MFKQGDTESKYDKDLKRDKKYGDQYGLDNLMSESRENHQTEKNKEIFSKIGADYNLLPGFGESDCNNQMLALMPPSDIYQDN